MDCRKADKLLALYVSDDLSKEERARLDEHLAGCPDCIEKVNLLRADRERIQLLAGEEAPDAGGEFFEEVLEKIARNTMPQRSHLTVWLPLMGAAAAVLIVSLVIFSGVLETATPPAEPVVAPTTTIDDKYIRPAAGSKSVKDTDRTIRVIRRHFRPTRFERVRIPSKKRVRTAEF
jgi:anti-sigma factor RsiW